MALPNPASQSGMVPIGMVQYQQASFKESIANAMKGFGELSAMRMLTKSPLLRMIGGGAIAEGVDIKRRERLAAAGRDPNTGRKLTKDELYEREARKKDLGALSEIKEILQALKITENGGIVRVAVAEGGLGGGTNRLFAGGDRSKQISIAPPEEGDAYTLADEERDAEKEKEDDEDQLESEKRQQGFFSKLFMGMRPDRDGKGGLLGLLMGVVSSIGSVIANIGGFLKDGVVGLLSTVFNATKLLGMGVIKALMPFAGILIPMLLATAAGYAIKSWIDKWREEEEAAGEMGKNTRMVRAFRVTDASGKQRFVRESELESVGTSPEDLYTMSAKGDVSAKLPDGSTIETKPFTMMERKDESTGEYNLLPYSAGTPEDITRLAPALPKEAFEIATGQRFAATSAEEKRFLFNKDNKAIIDEVSRINGEMNNYTQDLLANQGSLDSNAVAESFASKWNLIMDRVRRLVEKHPRKDLLKLLDMVAERYPLFSRAITEEGVTSREAFRDGDLMFGNRLRIPANLGGFFAPSNEELVIGKSGTGIFDDESGKMLDFFTREIEPIQSPIPLPKPEPVARPTRRVGSEIGNLESSRTMPTSAPTNIVTTTNSNTNNSGGNVLMAPLNTATVASNKSGMLVNRYGIPLAGAFNFGR